MFRKILIANRGEIAVRVIRACREMGISSVAVYSEADESSLHVRLADESMCIGPAASAESYLSIPKILGAALAQKAQAIHPGYGFLSENAHFAAECAKAGVVFIGPPPSAISSMGSKLMARQLMQNAGVPVVPGTLEPVTDEEEARAIAHKIGYPVMIKASSGGGGKGMRLVTSDAELVSALRNARSESARAFGDDAVYLEKFVAQPRHVEMQIFCDSFGNAVHLYERDCSIQRRHQKVIEETPCPVIRPEVRERMADVAIKAARAVGYVGAGTVEFLMDADQNFYFLEMNTRLQVEHPITELITGFDLVKAQIQVASGQPLPFAQQDIRPRGAAMECRIYAEDPSSGFTPAPGRIEHLREPMGPFVRIDGCAYPGWEVPIHYDSLIAKLAVWAPTRPEAIDRMRRALSEFTISPLRTTISFHRRVMENARFQSGYYTTGFIAEEFSTPDLYSPDDETTKIVAVLAAMAHSTAEQTAPASLTRVSSPTQASLWGLSGRLSGGHRLG